MPRADDRRVIGGIIHVIRNGLMWRDVSAAYASHNTLPLAVVRWSCSGLFDRMVAPLAAESTKTETVMIDRLISKRIASHRIASHRGEVA